MVYLCILHQEQVLLAAKGPYLMAFRLSVTEMTVETVEMKHVLVSQKLPTNCKHATYTTCVFVSHLCI